MRGSAGNTITLERLADRSFVAGMPRDNRRAALKQLNMDLLRTCGALNRGFRAKPDNIPFMSFGYTKQEAEAGFVIVDPISHPEGLYKLDNEKAMQWIIDTKAHAMRNPISENELRILDRAIPMVCGQEEAVALNGLVNKALGNLDGGLMYFMSYGKNDPFTGVFIYGKGRMHDGIYRFTDENACSISCQNAAFSITNGSSRPDIVLRHRFTAHEWQEVFPLRRPTGNLLEAINAFIRSSGADPLHFPEKLSEILNLRLVSLKMRCALAHEKGHRVSLEKNLSLVNGDRRLIVNIPNVPPWLIFEELTADLSDNGALACITGTAKTEPADATAMFLGTLAAHAIYISNDNDPYNTLCNCMTMDLLLSCATDLRSIDFSKMEELRSLSAKALDRYYKEYVTAYVRNDDDREKNILPTFIETFSGITGLKNTGKIALTKLSVLEHLRHVCEAGNNRLPR